MGGVCRSCVCTDTYRGLGVDPRVAWAWWRGGVAYACFYVWTGVFVAVVKRGRIIPVLLFVLVVLARRGFSV